MTGDWIADLPWGAFIGVVAGPVSEAAEVDTLLAHSTLAVRAAVARKSTETVDAHFALRAIDFRPALAGFDTIAVLAEPVLWAVVVTSAIDDFANSCVRVAQHPERAMIRFELTPPRTRHEAGNAILAVGAIVWVELTSRNTESVLAEAVWTLAVRAAFVSGHALAALAEHSPRTGVVRSTTWLAEAVSAKPSWATLCVRSALGSWDTLAANAVKSLGAVFRRSTHVEDALVRHALGAGRTLTGVSAFDNVNTDAVPANCAGRAIQHGKAHLVGLAEEIDTRSPFRTAVIGPALADKDAASLDA